MRYTLKMQASRARALHRVCIEDGNRNRCKSKQYLATAVKLRQENFARNRCVPCPHLPLIKLYEVLTPFPMMTKFIVVPFASASDSNLTSSGLDRGRGLLGGRQF
ncbi:hypothetical protein AVEN_194120-1 [Araneus ventricosus]|uniref:Uncharacterized protein n=1 Tax=Araneus ventricosus TaxID=182803 RepID=A0A4Y2TBS0_ARAVE|nr:hypothetical protein AVEN_194120-1 [Araneus ventricosus]